MLLVLETRESLGQGKHVYPSAEYFWMHEQTGIGLRQVLLLASTLHPTGQAWHDGQVYLPFASLHLAPAGAESPTDLKMLLAEHETGTQFLLFLGSVT